MMGKRSDTTTSRRTAGRKAKTVATMVDPLHAKHRLRTAESAAYLAAIVESADDAIISKTLDGIVTSWNASAERIFGYTAQEMIGQPILRLIPPERQSEEDLILARLRAGERIEHFETVRMRKDGQRLEVSLTISPVRDRSGKIIGASKIAHDITEPRRLGQQVRWQASLLERSHDAIFMWELDGPILYWNHGAELLYGYSSAEAVGQISHQLLQTERPISPAEFREALRRTGEWIGNIQHTARDGRRLVVESRYQLLVEADGRAHVLETCRDITERLELEEALRRSHDELEQRVRERTRDLATANHSLRRLSRQVLEVQETERRRIARELHDEIGQALTGVKIMLETAHRKAATNETNSLVHTNPFPDLRDAIDDALSRVRELSLDLRPGMLDSLGLLPALLWRFDSYTRQTGIQVEFHHIGLDRRFAPEVETAAYRIVQEALTNVVRYADVPGVKVQFIASHDALRLYVIDEGPGFDAEKVMASGLSTGLASMRERATLLGGAFLVSSTPGEGTTIEVELPLVPGTEAENDRETERDTTRDAIRDAARDAGQSE
jgi:PAS domain S-box-containing protein